MWTTGNRILVTLPITDYFCCMVLANRDFVRRHPVATKRVLRSILKAADICAADPGRVARFLVDMRYETRYPIGFEVIKNLQFTRWREADPEDTLRFHALRLREAGCSSPYRRSSSPRAPTGASSTS
jgi:NitT/TauT family transport system substrate-binding protein